MTTQLQPVRLEHVSSTEPPMVEFGAQVIRFIAHPDGMVYVEDAYGDRYWHEGPRGRLRLWPYLVRHG